jgi:hypothetical protein
MDKMHDPSIIRWLIEQMKINHYINKKQLENSHWLIEEAKKDERLKNKNCFPYILFSDINQYRYLMDFSVFVVVPDNVKFYPISETENYIEFIGDGYGVSEEYKSKIEGEYGNGSIDVFKKDIPHLIEWCRNNFLK